MMHFRNRVFVGLSVVTVILGTLVLAVPLQRSSLSLPNHTTLVISHTQNPILWWYVAAWLSFCAVACRILWLDRSMLRTEMRRYWEFLIIKWKLALFVPAMLFVTFAGWFTDDETWDVVTGGGMSLLTFFSAPWCLGITSQVLKRKRPARYLIVAAALLLFSSSWFYDGYLLLRDGAYTTRWWSNLALSPILYLAAGLLWNLEASGRLGVRLGFLRANWPDAPEDKRILPILFVAIPLICIAAFILTAFVSWRSAWIHR